MKIARAMSVLLMILGMSEASFAQMPPEAKFTDLHVRTQFVDGKIIAVTNDGRFFSIVCSYPKIPVPLMSQNSSALMFLPNKDGDIVSAAYNKINRHTADKRSQAIPLANTAVVQICNEPNGTYLLRIKQEGEINEVLYVSGTTHSANTGRGRGY